MFNDYPKQQLDVHIMANTIVSIFPNADQARQAKEHLLTSGFSAAEVDLKIASYKSDDPVMASDDQHQNLLEKVTAFFKDLFGSDDQQVTQYAHAGSKGVIMTVHTDTSEDAEKVAGILDSFGALDTAETSGSFFPEDQVQSSQHQFLDNPAYLSSEGPVTGTDAGYIARAARLKSRIVARSVEKQSGNPTDSLY
jgi:hypothetical protein